MVTGAPGSGKSTVVPELVRLSPGNLVVMDMDELLDDNGRLLGIDIASPTAAPIWPAYNGLWLRITELIRRDLPYYDTTISRDFVAGMNRFARHVDILSGDVPYEKVVAMAV